MVVRKGINIKKKLTSRDRWYKSLADNNTWNNPDKLSNCISYCNNGKWVVRDKNNNNKIIKTFNSIEEYDNWCESITDPLYMWDEIDDPNDTDDPEYAFN